MTAVEMVSGDRGKRVLVTGANGFVGREVARQLDAKGYEVVGLVRTEARLVDSCKNIAVGDFAEVECWESYMTGVDCVVHCAARAHRTSQRDREATEDFQRDNVDVTLSLARAAVAAGTRRFIFISSVGVNGDRTVSGRRFRHNDVPAPHSAYAEAKWSAEIGLLKEAQGSNLEVVIIRPPLVIGPSPKGNLRSLASVIGCGIPLPFGRVTKNRRDFVSLDTLVDLVATCIEHERAAGETFLVADGNPLNTRELLYAVGSLIGRKPRVFPFPVFVLRSALQAIGRDKLAEQLMGNLEVDLSHTCNTLGWRPPYRDEAGSASR